MTSREAIDNLKMCRELMLFDPAHGDTIEYASLNAVDQNLYDACGVAISVLSKLIDHDEEIMDAEQLEWCQTLNGNCILCKFQEECELCTLNKIKNISSTRRESQSCDEL